MTEKLRFDDLTKIACPFGMLDDDTKERLMTHERVEVFDNVTGLWCIRHKSETDYKWFDTVMYRAVTHYDENGNETTDRLSFDDKNESGLLTNTVREKLCVCNSVRDIQTEN